MTPTEPCLASTEGYPQNTPDGPLIGNSTA